MGQLDNKVAIITGASSGIGAMAARIFAAEGAQVVLTARRASLLNEQVTEISQAGGQAVALAGDVREEAHAKALVALAVDRFGGLDIAYNNVGAVGEIVSGTDTSLDTWNSALASNLTSAFLGAKYQIPEIVKRGGGSVIFTGTFVGQTVGFPGTAAYAASKAGLIGLSQVLAAENGPNGVRVNVLLPGGTDTPMAEVFMPDADARGFIENLYALKRIADPVEIARVALFLASNAASFVTGTAMLADGGVSINRT